MTLSFTMSGANVIAYPFSGSPTAVCHIRLPLIASMATSCASSVAMNNVSPRIATPRFTRPQHGLADRDGTCSKTQKMRPVLASRATTSFGAWVTYMIPSMTNGVEVKFSNDRA